MNKERIEQRIKEVINNVIDVKILTDDCFTTVIVLKDRQASEIVSIFNFVDDDLSRMTGSIYVNEMNSIQQIFKEETKGLW